MAEWDKRHRDMMLQLVECRWIAMERLADHFEKIGNFSTAEGWRWLAKHKKWPVCSVILVVNNLQCIYYWDVDSDSPNQCLPGEVCDLVARNAPDGIDLDLQQLLLRTAIALGNWLPSAS